MLLKDFGQKLKKFHLNKRSIFLKLQLVKIGPIKSKEIDSLCDNYLKRLKPYIKTETIVLKDPDGAKGERNDSILSTLNQSSGHKVFLLDERGKKLSSEEFAQFFKNHKDEPATKSVSLVVGGAFGFSKEVRKNADGLISFSDMVFPNEIAWLILNEQSYRGFSILAGSSYHHT
jgi:23S rRNA (pseudouridine1915-N3)-methyltransferase